ncbi:MAG: S1 RNA-binding domain-containing protein, partial [Bdellovibrionaceae bacterium]|nr:S1 RNA-binding domain-containing protein [Pseudobdellovibrionaceae bacterium]
MPTPFAILKVVDATDIGCFLDQGQDKDLFLPRSEEYEDVRIGDQVLVAIYEDKQGRPCSSMRLDKFTNKEITGLTPGQQVDILI